MELMEAIKGRRSVRKYKPDPVPEASLKTVLEAVKWSPSWANTQCWEIVVVRVQKIKADLAAALSKTNPALPAMAAAPLVLVLCGKKGVSGYYKGQAATVRGDWLMFDTGIAMQNLCLAAHSLGLATVVVGLFDHKKVEEILRTPDNVEVMAMTPLGYPEAPGGATKRKEFSEFVFYDGYGQK